uniref:Caspase family p20 domain-containing protein n=1 Tax=Salarias fasciatus TaxID=181472 RepID=A0A672I710_SALFA
RCGCVCVCVCLCVCVCAGVTISRAGVSGGVNRAVLVSVENFYPGVGLANRPGAKRDTKRLHRVLRRRGFQVELHQDLSSQEIHQLQRPVKDLFLTVLSSHGDGGCVFGADGEPVQLSQILTFFDNKTMEDKTKLFLIQVSGALESCAQVRTSRREQVEADALLSGSPGYGAFMHPLGSVFLQTFCDLLEDAACRNLALTRLMTRLAGKRMMPCFLMRLTRDVFPFAEPGKEGGASGVTARSLVEMDSVRRRTPSIS